MNEKTSVLTLEFLETGESQLAICWRYIRDHPLQTRDDYVAQLSGNRKAIYTRIQRLKKAKWVLARKRGREVKYTASRSGTTRPDARSGNMTIAKKRLTDLATQAEVARRSAITTRMSETLADIEIEARRIRDDL